MKSDNKDNTETGKKKDESPENTKETDSKKNDLLETSPAAPTCSVNAADAPSEDEMEKNFIKLLIFFVFFVLVILSVAKLFSKGGCAIIVMRGPFTGGEKTEVQFEGHTITVEGRNYDELEIAADRLGLLLLDANMSRVNKRQLEGTRKMVYYVYTTVKTRDGREQIVPFGFRSNPYEASQVKIVNERQLKSFLSKPKKRWVFVIGEKTSPLSALSASEISKVVGFKYAHTLNVTTDIITVQSYAEADKACSMR